MTALTCPVRRTARCAGGVSRPCDECSAVKRCRMHVSDRADVAAETRIVYLCRACARELGYEGAR